MVNGEKLKKARKTWTLECIGSWNGEDFTIFSRLFWPRSEQCGKNDIRHVSLSGNVCTVRVVFLFYLSILDFPFGFQSEERKKVKSKSRKFSIFSLEAWNCCKWFSGLRWGKLIVTNENLAQINELFILRLFPSFSLAHNKIHENHSTSADGYFIFPHFPSICSLGMFRPLTRSSQMKGKLLFIAIHFQQLIASISLRWSCLHF